MNRTVTRYFYDHPKSRELQLQIRDDEDDPHQSDERREIFALVPYSKEIGLCLETVFPTDFPHLRQNEEGNHIHQWLVSENIQNGCAFGVRPAARPEKRERCIDLPCHQQPHQQHTEASVANGPLFQIHLAASSGIKDYKCAY